MSDNVKLKYISTSSAAHMYIYTYHPLIEPSTWCHHVGEILCPVPPCLDNTNVCMSATSSALYWGPAKLVDRDRDSPFFFLFCMVEEVCEFRAYCHYQ